MKLSHSCFKLPQFSGFSSHLWLKHDCPHVSFAFTPFALVNIRFLLRCLAHFSSAILMSSLRTVNLYCKKHSALDFNDKKINSSSKNIVVHRFSVQFSTVNRKGLLKWVIPKSPWVSIQKSSLKTWMIWRGHPHDFENLQILIVLSW